MMPSNGEVAVVEPTAQALSAEVAVTPSRSALARGSLTRFQAKPFQRRTSGVNALVEPTAQARPAETAATAFSVPWIPPWIPPGAATAAWLVAASPLTEPVTSRETAVRLSFLAILGTFGLPTTA